MVEKFNTYKGYPLVRCGDQLYYGYMSDPYVIWIQILGTKDVNGEKVTSNVRITRIKTTEPDPLKAYEKKTDRECGLYEALDVASVWLEKALSNK